MKIQCVQEKRIVFLFKKELYIRITNGKLLQNVHWKVVN